MTRVFVLCAVRGKPKKRPGVAALPALNIPEEIYEMYRVKPAGIGNVRKRA
jgi:hypothetical protein